LRQFVDEGHDFIATWDGQGAARAEIGLDIYDEQGAIWLHGWYYKEIARGDIDRGREMA